MKSTTLKIAEFFDPCRRGVFFTRYGLAGILFISIAFFLFYFLIKAGAGGAFMWLLGLVSVGLHEFGHNFFGIISGNSRFITIIGGTLMEIAVPLAAFLYFQRKGREIQADICLLFLAIAFKSVGFYSGISLYSGEVMIFNAVDGANSVADWDYMHKWFFTEGKEYYVQQIFYMLSALSASFGLWLLYSHTVRWIKADPVGDAED